MTTAGMRSLVVASILLGLGCGGNVAPASPTWEADVYPILQGQCLHCHGSTWETNGGGRYDFYDLSKCGEMGFADPNVRFSTSPGILLTSLEPQDDGEGRSYRSFMPPQPASVLEDWELQTIKNWSKVSKEKQRGSRSPSRNSDPKIIITSKYPDKVGDELKVSYRFADEDGDPVIGVLKFGDAKVVDLLKFSGQVTLSGFTAQSGDTLKLSAVLCDGWEQVTVDIKDLEKE